MSFANLNMYLATIPVYDPKEEKKKEEKEDLIDGLDALKDLNW